jgi:hypothetical protein
MPAIKKLGFRTNSAEDNQLVVQKNERNDKIALHTPQRL